MLPNILQCLLIPSIVAVAVGDALQSAPVQWSAMGLLGVLTIWLMKYTWQSQRDARAERKTLIEIIQDERATRDRERELEHRANEAERAAAAAAFLNALRENREHFASLDKLRRTECGEHLTHILKREREAQKETQ